MNQLFVHLLPHGNTPSGLEQSTAVVIDVLRASTTIVAALAQGALEVIPVADLETARSMAAQGKPQGWLLGGERGGERIPGFDLGNSPGEYGEQAVLGRHIVFTTSHGTRAIGWSRPAAAVWIGCFANLSALVERLICVDTDVHLVCSGTDGEPSLEDTLCAAAIAGRLWEQLERPTWHDDTAQLMLELHRSGSWKDAEQRHGLLSSGRGGRRLTRLGLADDIEYVSRLDRFDIVPRLDCSEAYPRLVR